MAFAPINSRSPFTPFRLSPSYPFKFSTKLFPQLPLNFPKITRSIIVSSSSSSSSNPQSSPFTSEQAFIDALAGFDASGKALPCVRTLENDLARLSLVGAVDVQQALTAAAADGGEAADEHIASGTDAMVVETVFPADGSSTVSTRLFLPARKVKEKAIKLRRSLTKDIFESASSKNILAMTFRQVVLQQLWSFELSLFAPGTERNMDDLGNSREVSNVLCLSSTDDRIITGIGEVVCLAVLNDTERSFFRDSMGRARNKLFNMDELLSSKDSSVVMYNLLEHEILANSKALLQIFKSRRRNYMLNKMRKSKDSWWTSPALAKLEKIGGPEFRDWVTEFVPSYKLVIDGSKFDNVKFEGWTKNLEGGGKSEADCWEVELTHSQMVNLADILDIYFEDGFTLPYKSLSCYPIAKSSKLTLNKGSSFLKMASIVIASGIFLVTISVLQKVYFPYLSSRKTHDTRPQLSDVNSAPLHSVDVSQVRECCISTITRIKNSFGWPEDIRTNNCCAWIGELPISLRVVDDVEPKMLDDSPSSVLPITSEEEMKALEDIASYQVIWSIDGGVVGVQPTNRVAVNNWAANPLAKDLYGGKNLSPGLLERGLKMSSPSEVVVVELLISLNPDYRCALARAVDISGER